MNEYSLRSVIKEQRWAVHILLPSRGKKQPENVPQEKHDMELKLILGALTH